MLSVLRKFEEQEPISARWNQGKNQINAEELRQFSSLMVL